MSDEGTPLDDAFDGLVGALAEAARSVREHPFFADPENRPSAYQFVLSMLIARLEEEVIFDPDFPNLRSVDVRIREAGDNPDQRYWTSRLRGGATYRIWGNVGTARRVDVADLRGHPRATGWRAIRGLPRSRSPRPRTRRFVRGDRVADAGTGELDRVPARRHAPVRAAGVQRLGP